MAYGLVVIVNSNNIILLSRVILYIERSDTIKILVASYRTYNILCIYTRMYTPY